MNVNRWDDLESVEKFLLCIPLKTGALIITVFGIIYGFIGLFFITSMIINFSLWKSVYITKVDVLVYLFFVFCIISELFFASILLLVGILTDNDDLVVVYLWFTAVHVVLNWVITLAVFIDCAFVDLSCFQDSGVGQAVSSIIITAFYSFFWSYIIVVVNSFRMDM